MQSIDWHSSQSHVFINPKLSDQFSPIHLKNFKELCGHIWIATSGTTEQAKGVIKWVALSKKAFLNSALAVNTHLKSNHSDIWLNVLPLFHVGGLSIYARAFLSSAQVVQMPEKKWDPHFFIERLKSSKATLVSVVPSQLYDLVCQNYCPSQELRAVIVGGGTLSDQLFEKAKKLKWPLMPSYGMTECCSQITTARLGEFELNILPHVKCTTSNEGFLQLEGDSLFTGYLYIINGEYVWDNPKNGFVFTSTDQVKIIGNTLTFLGRHRDIIKIGGEKVNLFQLDTFFQSIKPPYIEAYLTSKQDDRLESIIELVALTEHENETLSLIDSFNQGVMPYEKIRSVRFVEKFKRSSLGKTIR